MSKVKILLMVGVWVAVLPYLGFPYVLKNILFSLTGLCIILFGYMQMGKEENKKEMADLLQINGIKILVSHITNLESAADFLEVLAENLLAERLSDFAERYRAIIRKKKQLSVEKFFYNIELQKNSELNSNFNILEYVIWKNPFMVIGKATFISEVFKLVDIDLVRHEKYPVISDDELKNKYCLFSSEPYPFAKAFVELTTQGYKGMLVDGEKISWYGIRNLEFLESCLN